jgi:hypothetical protein
LVLTLFGELAVEEIRPGDPVLTAECEVATVRRVGRQSLPSFAEGVVPVAITANALGVGVPYVDLHVSADHAVLVDGFLVCARALVDGVSVFDMVDPPRIVEYYHLELDWHKDIVAAGAPVESFVDDVTRRGFDNYHEWIDLGLEPLPADPIGYLKVKSARQLPASVRRRLAGRAGAPTTRSPQATTAPRQRVGS